LTIVEYLYDQGVQAGDLGFASAVGWGLLLIIFVLTALQVRISRVPLAASRRGGPRRRS